MGVSFALAARGRASAHARAAADWARKPRRARGVRGGVFGSLIAASVLCEVGGLDLADGGHGFEASDRGRRAIEVDGKSRFVLKHLPEGLVALSFRLIN